tara:strand:- start:429 stop:599 length:171 start_codon:yes stop_codon:yes gene_type:complete
MTKEQKDILLQGNDLLISQVSAAINQEQENREGLRAFLKEAIAAGDKLKALEDESE